MLRAGGVGGEEWEIYLCLHRLREFDLSLFSRLFEALEDHLVMGDVDPLVLFELGYEVFHQALVDIVAA